MTRRYIVGMILYICAFGLAFVSVWTSLAVIVGPALLFVLPEPSVSSIPEGPRHGESDALPDRSIE